MSKRVLSRAAVLASVLAATACTSGAPDGSHPELAPRGTVMTTAKPTRQNLTNKVGLTGKVVMNPVFGLTAPVGGQVRYLEVPPATATPTKPTRVATVWADGKPNHVEVPAGSTFGGRLVDDRATVTTGMPVASAKYAGYGIAADLDGEQAYQIADAVSGTIQAQIKNGPGPFPCTLLGTIAALPAGTVPAPPPAPEPEEQEERPSGRPTPPQRQPQQPGSGPSDPTGLRLVCTAPADVKLINGATATLEVVTASVQDALVVPVEAVAGGQGRGKVDVVDVVGADGAKQTRDVVLGLTDGKVVEIKEGLTGEETLAVPGPDLQSAPEGQATPAAGSK